MKFIYLMSFVLVMTVALSCVKREASVPDTIEADLTFTQVNIPLSVTRFQDIVVGIQVTGPNQCYKLADLQIRQMAPLEFNIIAKAKIPNPEKGPVNCPTPSYTKDTTFSIPTHLQGKHVIRFVTNGQLYRADTVMVN